MHRALAPVLLSVFLACGSSRQAPETTRSTEPSGGGAAPSESAAPAAAADSFARDPTGATPAGGLQPATGAVGPAAAKVNACSKDCIQRRQKDAVSIDTIERQCRQQCVDECVDGCVRSRQMQAMSIERIRAECRTDCGGD